MPCSLGYKQLLQSVTLDTSSLYMQNHLEFTRNVDITSYEGGKRRTHNPEGRAFASVVWEFFKVNFSSPEIHAMYMGANFSNY